LRFARNVNEEFEVVLLAQLDRLQCNYIKRAQASASCIYQPLPTQKPRVENAKKSKNQLGCSPVAPVLWQAHPIAGLSIVIRITRRIGNRSVDSASAQPY
jgi:hypothetical protein